MLTYEAAPFGNAVLGSIVVILKPVDSVESATRGMGNEARAVLYSVIAESDPSLWQKIHDESNLKPFTVSSLIDGAGKKRLKPGYSQQLYWIRFTTLTTEVYKALMQSLLDRYRNGQKIELGRHIFEVERLVLGGTSEKYAAVTSYYSLWQCLPRKEFKFRFMSPTSFRVGQGNLPFPLPYSVYHSLWRKWAQFAPSDLRIEEEILQTVTEHVFPAQHAIRTALVEEKGFKLLGFVGTCRFEVIGEVSEEKLHKLAVLTEYAYYAGVGMKTTQGMGQTLIEKKSGK